MNAFADFSTMSWYPFSVSGFTAAITFPSTGELDTISVEDNSVDTSVPQNPPGLVVWIPN
jgi:hypothetical protein